MVTFQGYLNKKYPTQSEKEQVTEIRIGWSDSKDNLPRAETKHLDGAELNLISYPNLKRVSINGTWLKTKLTSLNVSNCPQLETIQCANNYLTQLIYPVQLEVITHLDIRNNNITTSYLRTRTRN